MSAVFVTGATGNVGAEVVLQLLRRGVAVKAAVLPGPGETVAEGSVKVEFDFEDPATFGPALEGVERVFLMRPPDMSEPGAFRPFIAAMAAGRVGQVVFLSVQGAGRNVFVPHHGIEVLLKKSGLAWTFLRPSFFMQNLSGVHRADIRDRSEVYVPAGSGRTNFVDASDVAEAAAVCLTSFGHDRKAYEITGAEALTYEEVAQILSDTCGRRIAYPRPSRREFKVRMKAAGHGNEFARVMVAIYTVAKLGMASGTTDVFETLVGRKPLTLREWAQDNTECWR